MKSGDQERNIPGLLSGWVLKRLRRLLSANRNEFGGALFNPDKGIGRGSFTNGCGIFLQRVQNSSDYSIHQKHERRFGGLENIEFSGELNRWSGMVLRLTTAQTRWHCGCIMSFRKSSLKSELGEKQS
jgi:hypothetical protein